MPVPYDWMETVHGALQEEVPHDAPYVKGNVAHTSTYADANLLEALKSLF